MIKEFRVLGNNRLFKEVLSDSSKVELMNRSSSSFFVKYRNYRNPEARELSLRKSRKLSNLIRDHFAKLEVDFTLIELTITEVKRVVALYFAKVNNRKLTESQIAIINDLREKTARERKKEAHKKRFKEAKSLRLFLKNQNIVYLKSSKDRNEFLKIKLIHDAYLEKKPYDKIQKDYLEKLRLRTRDLSNNFNNSRSKTKPGLIRNNLQDVENKMIKKKKDQVQERFSKERYVQDYEKWFPEKEYQINHQRQVQESRKNILHELKKINRSLENFDKDCVYCNYKGTYSIHIEPNLDEFEIEIEKDVEDVICVRPDVPQKKDFYDESEKIPVPKEKVSIYSEEIVQEISNKSLEEDIEEVICVKEKVPIHSEEIHEEQFNDVELKKLKNLQRSSKAMVKKTAKKVLDLTVHKRRVRNFLNGIKNATIADVLLESSLTATQSKKRLQERAQSDMDAARSRKKITKFVRIRSKLTTIQLSDNSITLVKNVGIIHILCLFFLPSFLFATIPKTEINSFFGLFLLLTYSIVSLYLISFSISHLILRNNRFRTLTFCLRPLIKSLKIFRFENENNAEIQKNGSKKARLKYENRFEEIKISKNPKSKDKNKKKPTIRGKEAFFSFLLTKVYGVKTGYNLEQVRKKGKKRAKLEEENSVENIEITFKRKQELARSKSDFYDFLLEKVFGRKHLKNNKLKCPKSHLRPKGKKIKVKVVRRKRSVRWFRNSNRSSNESFENNSTISNSVSVPRKEDLKKIQELNKEIPLKSFGIVRYHDMGSRMEYEEELIQKYKKKEGIPDSYLVNEKIRDISDSDRVIGLYLEKNHRKKFDKFFSRNLTLAKLLNYSTDLSLIKIAKNREKWIIIANLNIDSKTSKQQLSNLLEKVSKSILIFKNIELRKFGISLRLTKDHFIGRDIKVFRYLKTTPSCLNIDNFNERTIKMRAKTLTSIIEQNGGKVRLFFGVSLDDTMGVQYVKKSPSTHIRNTQYRFYPQKGIDQVSFIDIDIINDPNAHNILKAIAKLSLVYIPGIKFRTPFFVMSKWGRDYNNMICAFDHRKFYSENEIYSPMQASSTDSYTRYDQVNIIGTDGIFDINRANDLWNLYGLFYPYSSRDNLNLIPNMNDY